MRRDAPLTNDKITEPEARRLLAHMGSPAQDSAKYGAHRYDVGWVFSWGAADQEMPMGEAPWVVTDSGVAARVPIGSDSRRFLGETSEDAER